MMRCPLICTTLLALTGGCATSMTVESLRDMMPSRPPEMARLQPLIGRWDTAADMHMICFDHTLAINGVSENSWADDGWHMLERSEFEIAGLGKVHELGVWAWDPSAKAFRTWRFDTWGGTRIGTAAFDEKSKTWTLKAKRKSAWGSSTDRGTIVLADESTLEWTWQEWPAWDLLHVFKVAEFNGKSKRK